MALKGLGGLRAALEKYREILMGKLGRAAVEEMELVKADSMDNCPVAPGGGTLKASHEVVFSRDGDKVEVRIEVGGAAEPYALAVHEHLSEHSPQSWLTAEAAGRPVQFNVGGPKFLENAVRRAAPGFAARVAARVS
jgi:hypothetical protein